MTTTFTRLHMEAANKEWLPPGTFTGPTPCDPTTPHICWRLSAFLGLWNQLHFISDIPLYVHQQSSQGGPSYQPINGRCLWLGLPSVREQLDNEELSRCSVRLCQDHVKTHQTRTTETALRKLHQKSGTAASYASHIHHYLANTDWNEAACLAVKDELALGRGTLQPKYLYTISHPKWQQAKGRSGEGITTLRGGVRLETHANTCSEPIQVDGSHWRLTPEKQE